MSILTGNQIKESVDSADILINPFDPSKLNPNSMNMTLSGDMLRFVRTKESRIRIDSASPPPESAYEPCPLVQSPSGRAAFKIIPGDLYLGSTKEVAGSSKFVPCIEGRSSFARLGLSIHITAGFGDIGFFGTWTLEISSIYETYIYPGQEICQIYFMTVEGKAETKYRGKYCQQDGPTIAESTK